MWIFALSFNHLFIENVFEVHNFITKWMEFIHSFLAAFYQSCCSRNGSFTLLFEVRVASWLDHEGKKNIFATHFPLDVVYIYKVFPIPLTIPVHSVTFHQYYKEQIYIERFIYFFIRPKGNFYFAFFQKLSILALLEVIFLEIARSGLWAQKCWTLNLCFKSCIDFDQSRVHLLSHFFVNLLIVSEF